MSDAVAKYKVTIELDLSEDVVAALSLRAVEMSHDFPNATIASILIGEVGGMLSGEYGDDYIHGKCTLYNYAKGIDLCSRFE